MRAKRHPLFAHLAQFAEAEYLEPARVGQDRPPPRHESVQSAELPHLLHARPQIQMVGVPQKNLHPEFLKDVLRHPLDRPDRPDRHEHRRGNDAVCGRQRATPRVLASSLDLKIDRHWWNCKGRLRQPCRIVILSAAKDLCMSPPALNDGCAYAVSSYGGLYEPCGKDSSFVPFV